MGNKEYDDKRNNGNDEKQVENHDITKEATAKAQELISLAQRDAKTIRLGARDYADEILCQLDKELELKVQQMVQALKVDVDQFIQNVVGEISSTSNDIRENVKELRNMK